MTSDLLYRAVIMQLQIDTRFKGETLPLEDRRSAHIVKKRELFLWPSFAIHIQHIP
jgi:hypothetical protein